MLFSGNNDRKRPSLETSQVGGAFDRPNKRQFSGHALTAEEKVIQQHQHFPLRNGLMGNSLMGNHSHQQAQNLADYQNSLLASNLANRHAELAQRQLLSRYFPAQLQINQFNQYAGNMAVPPSMGLGLAGHRHMNGSMNTNTNGACAPVGQNHPLASLFSQPQGNTGEMNHMTSRFQHPNSAAALAQAEGFQSSSSGHPRERLQDNSGMPTGMRRTSQAGLHSTNKEAVLNTYSVGHALSASSSVRSNSFTNALANTGNEASPIPLGIDEDPNWLSDFHVYVRSNLVELCWASSEDVALRNASNRVSSHQVGIRCRCCAHLNPSARAQRSSAFPSSIAQIYQSFTMMLRAHFSSCTEVPPAIKEKFLALKSKTTQGATDSKQYWIYSARRLGMVDSEEGIVMTKATTAAARTIAPFGSEHRSGGSEESAPLPLVAPNDRALASDFLYTLMLQARRVKLQVNEQRGNKKSLQLGLPGFACRHCCQLGRMGQCRIFPARRRTLPTKIYDLFEHLQRCTACPKETKELLEVLHDRENYQAKTPGHKELLDLIWSRLVDQHHA